MTVQGERTVELVQCFLGLLAVHTHHDAVGLHKVFNGGTLFQELRVRGDIKAECGPTSF